MVWNTYTDTTNYLIASQYNHWTFSNISFIECTFYKKIDALSLMYNYILKTLVMPDFKDHWTVRPDLSGHGTTRAT